MKTRYAMTVLSLVLLAAAIIYDATAHGSSLRGRTVAQIANVKEEGRYRLLSMFTPEQRKLANEMLEWLQQQSAGFLPLPKSGTERNSSPQRR